MDTTGPFRIEFSEGWDRHLPKDRAVRERIFKKIDQLEQGLLFRHLKHSLPFFVIEVGQYRIVFCEYQSEKKRKIVFVGDHKNYERWYSSF